VSELTQLIGQLVHAPTAQDNKYTRGVLGFVTGSNAYPGAALLGVAAAEAVSVGMVEYFGPQRVQDLLLVDHPQVVAAESVAGARAQAWVLGSGVVAPSEASVPVKSIDDFTQIANVCAAAYGQGSVAVVDAGAIALLDYAKTVSGSLILTPHDGELKRLFTRLQEPFRDSDFDTLQHRMSTTQRAAQLLGQTILLKGSTTVIAQPFEQTIAVGPNSPHLATAGSGDVLAGIIGALAVTNLAEVGESWLRVAKLAVLLHSRAAELTAREGLAVASALPTQVSKILRGEA
jgi:hydroxyethylthiazole kinase-like uncharacterized protein yjeF